VASNIGLFVMCTVYKLHDQHSTCHLPPRGAAKFVSKLLNTGIHTNTYMGSAKGTSEFAFIM
jgi:hypothetical protein